MGRGAEAQGPNRCINRAWEDHCEAPVARRAQEVLASDLQKVFPDVRNLVAGDAV